VDTAIKMAPARSEDHGHRMAGTTCLGAWLWGWAKQRSKNELCDWSKAKILTTFNFFNSVEKHGHQSQHFASY
jgi:hypothetical protein